MVNKRKINRHHVPPPERYFMVRENHNFTKILPTIYHSIPLPSSFTISIFMQANITNEFCLVTKMVFTLLFAQFFYKFIQTTLKSRM